MRMERRPELDFMNAIACLLVILIHVVSIGIVTVDRSSWQAAVIYFPWRFAAFVVPMFVYTAAVKLALHYGGGVVTWRGYLQYCWNRIQKIFLPYVLWCGIYYADRLLCGQAAETVSEFFWYVLTGKLSAPLYFIVILIQFYLTMPLWVWLVNHVPAVAAGGTSLFVSLCMGQAASFLSHFGITFPYIDRLCLTYGFFWVVGLYTGKNYDRIVPVLRKRWTLFCSGAAVAVYCILFYIVYAQEMFLPNTFDIKLAADFLSILLLHAVCLRLKAKPVTALLQKVYQASFTVYLSHCLFLNILERSLVRHGVTRLTYILLFRMAVCYTVPFLLCWLLAKLRGRLPGPQTRGKA